MFLDTGIKTECFGCEACQQICPKQAISMQEDKEGFRYPTINEAICIHCNLCRKTCPQAVMPEKHRNNKYAFGGYSKARCSLKALLVEPSLRWLTFCDKDYVIFGAEARFARL